jgi:hypothetical protein
MCEVMMKNTLIMVKFGMSFVYFCVSVIVFVSLQIVRIVRVTGPQLGPHQHIYMAWGEKKERKNIDSRGRSR